MKVFTGQADFGAGPQQVSAPFIVRDLEADPRNDSTLYRQGTETQGAIRPRRCGAASSRLSPSRTWRKSAANNSRRMATPMLATALRSHSASRPAAR